jgi:2-C-methyl-D-erythritol 4-phosphate cytidylyltransferase
MSKTCAIVPAAGRGLRMGAMKPKQFLELSGKPILLHTLETLSRADFLSEILVVVPKEFLAAGEKLVRQSRGNVPKSVDGSSARSFSGGCSPVDEDASAAGLSRAHRRDGGCPHLRLVVGGTERQDSVFNGLQALPSDCDWVFIHDGVRPFASQALLRNTLEAAHKTGAAIAALPASDTIKRVHAAQVLETLPRDEIWLVQTPQVFRREIIFEAYLEARRQGWAGTDDASFVERLGLPVAVVPGERSNIKVTTREDLAWGNWFMAQVPVASEPATASESDRCE